MATRHGSVYSLPVKAVPARFERVEIDWRFRANRLVGLVENHYVPGGLRLEYGDVILATAFGADDGITVPVVVTNQPHAGQRNPICI